MASVREIKEGLQEQGAEEKITYTLTTTPWGSSPGTITAAAFLVNETVTPNTYTDKTSTIFPVNNPSAVGDVITLSPCFGSAMDVESLYRIEIKFTCSGNIFEAYGQIRCKR